MMKKIRMGLFLFVAGFAVQGLFACEDSNPSSTYSDSDTDGDSDTDSDADSDNDTDNDSDSDTDSDSDGPTGSLSGKVWSPSQTIPISGALIYLTKNLPPDIPDEVYAYECDEMSGQPYTLSLADGTWTIAEAPIGEWYIVTRKGNFRRIREVTVLENQDVEVPHDDTTLPGDDSSDGMDTIPNYAVLYTYPDLVHNLLAKFGMGDVDSSGDVIIGTETFDLYNNRNVESGYPTTQDLFQSQSTVNGQHMIFFPCNADSTGVSFVTGEFSKLETYVAAGGKLYNSCCCALWTEGPFPEYIEYYGSNSATVFDIGRVSSFDYSTTGEILDEGLSAWLEVVTSENTSAFPFDYGYVQILNTVDVDDGNGLEDDDYWVLPKTWVVDNQAYPNSPLMVTYNYQSGKVFYTVYETSGMNAAITPQEYALLYVILEVGVCDNPPPPPV